MYYLVKKSEKEEALSTCNKNCTELLNQSLNLHNPSNQKYTPLIEF